MGAFFVYNFFAIVYLLFNFRLSSVYRGKVYCRHKPKGGFRYER